MHDRDDDHADHEHAEPADYTADDVRIYLCFEPDQLPCAEKLLEFSVVNAELAGYIARAAVPVDSSEAEPFKRATREQLARANVVLCVISYLTAQSGWVNWELQAARDASPRPLFVGVLLHEHDEIPEPMRNAGGMFTRFRRQNIAAAIDWVMTEKKTTDDYTQWED